MKFPVKNDLSSSKPSTNGTWVQKTKAKATSSSSKVKALQAPMNSANYHAPTKPPLIYGPQVTEAKGTKYSSTKVKSLGKFPAINELSSSKPPSTTGACWVKVTKGAKAISTKSESSQVPNRTSALWSNKYYVPKHLEKNLGNNFSKKASQLLQTDKMLSDKHSLRCHKRNQRRNKKRAQRRAEQNALNITHEFCPQEMFQPEDVTSPLAYAEDAWTDGILPFLGPRDVVAFGCCSKDANRLSVTGHTWKYFFKSEFPTSCLSPLSQREWRLAYKLSVTKAVERLRCSQSEKTFFEDTIGIGIDFTVNPKTKKVDYISAGQDLLSSTAFSEPANRKGVFGDEFKLLLPLYFSEDHFQRALPTIRQTILSLCPEQNTTKFDPLMILDVLPKIINTFVVLVADEGVAASRKSFNGLIRIHRLFLALAHEYPEIKNVAARRLKNFIANEEYRVKSVCPSLGNFLPLLMIVDEHMFQWSDVRFAYMRESLDRSVLWACKAHPELEDLNKLPADVRLKLTFQATRVGLRHKMLIAFFLWFLCKGTAFQRAAGYDNFRESDSKLPYTEQEEEKMNESSSPKTPPPTQMNQRLDFQKFRYFIHCILAVDKWQDYYKYVLAPCPKSKEDMAELLKNSVRNSLRKGYHKKGMNFAKIHASGTSKILSKGQKYSGGDGAMKRVRFSDKWTFDSVDNKIFLDATCLMYEGKKLVSTVDYSHTRDRSGAVIHSGDVMDGCSGTHTIDLDLQSLDPKITTLIFVLSAWAKATLNDIRSASVTFTDTNSGAELCSYHLESHNKIAHLKSIIMCKLYRANDTEGWHVLAIGDSHRGSADNYGPILSAARKFL